MKLPKRLQWVHNPHPAFQALVWLLFNAIVVWLLFWIAQLKAPLWIL